MTSLTRLVLSVLLPLLVVPVVLTSTPGPAYACSCVMGDPATFADSADAVFVGTVEADAGSWGQGGHVAQVSVERVYQGEVADDVTVSSGGPCGLNPARAGQRWLFYAGATGDAAYDASLCGGSTRAGARVLREVEAVLGAGLEPRTAAPTSPPVEPSVATEPTDADEVPEADDQVPTAVWAILGAALLLGAAVVLRARRPG